MAKYNVSIPFVCYVDVEVYAENEDDAKKMAFEEAYLDSYVGNGGYDKLIGVRGENLSVSPGDDIAYMDGFDVEVFEIE